VRRILNANVSGAPDRWADQLTSLVGEHRFDTLLLSIPDDGDPVGFIRRLGEDVAPRVRERV
jgi:hypothetical protein